MGQQETLKALTKADSWITVRELAKILGTSIGTVTVSLNKLQRQGEVKSREVPRTLKKEWKLI